MDSKRFVASLAFNLVLLAPALAQTPSRKPLNNEPEPARLELETRALALLDEVIAAATTLKLPENRAAVLGTAADLLWAHDQKRARSLFRDAISAQSEAWVDAGTQTWQGTNFKWMVAQQRRLTILAIARRDPQLAIELLHASRPPLGEGSPLDSSLNSQEGQLEQEVEILAAANDPKRIFQSAEKSLSKGFSYGLINLLQQLGQKDPEAAARFAVDILAKLKTENLSTNREASYVAVELLQTVMQPESNPSSRWLGRDAMHDLADIVITNAIDAPAYFMQYLQTAMPELEKRFPDRAPLLRNRFAEVTRILSDQNPWLKYQDLLQTGTPEAILEAAGKAPPEMRDNLYSQAAMKALGAGDTTRARQIANENLDTIQRDQLLAQIDQQASWNAIQAGRIDEARQIAARLATPESRANELLNIAERLEMKGDKNAAAEILNEALALIPRPPENQQQLNALIRVANQYVTIEPARAFEIVEPVIDQTNGLIDAAALLNGFSPVVQGVFRKGEMAVGEGWQRGGPESDYLQCSTTLAALAQTDFERAKKAAGRFQRSEARIMAYLLIVQRVLSNNHGPTFGAGFVGK